MKTLLPLVAIPLLLASCGADSQNKSTASTPQRKKLSERINEESGYKQDANGKWVPRSDKRSSFESQGESHFTGKSVKKQEYKAGDYAKKSWWGSKEYDRKSYAGNTDGSRFQQASDLGDKGAREASTTLTNTPDNYKTGEYATSAARETGNKQITKSSNDMIENRREQYTPPEIIHWKEQRTMSMDRSRGLLGGR